MNQDELIKRLRTLNPNALTFDGFLPAFVGVLLRTGRPAVALYDFEKCVKFVMTTSHGEDEAFVGSWTREEAEAFVRDQFVNSSKFDGWPAFAVICAMNDLDAT